MKKILYFAIPFLLIVIIVVTLLILKKSEENEIFVKPSKGTFKVIVTTSGELQAKNSIDIQGPTNARNLGIWQMKITQLIPEGTIVKKGDFVAELDKSEIMSKIKEIELTIQKFQSQILQSKLDSTLTLSSARDELENLKFSLEEKRLLKEQSIYEPPAIQRQVEIDYEKTKRAYEQAIANYSTKVKKAVANLQIIGTDLSKEEQKMMMLLDALKEFTITAPAEGMVIYAREWNGRSKVVGSTVSAWEPVVAKLPDLTSMESITYINEVDIQKIKLGQPVNIKLDAIPSKMFTGEVIKVANIGEQRSGSESKVFEVKIKINEVDSTLLPAMTTSNEILVATKENAIFIPLECLHSENEKYYIYKRNNGDIIKQEVLIGLMNENEVTIEQGLNENEEVMISLPQKDKKYNTIELTTKQEKAN